MTIERGKTVRLAQNTDQAVQQEATKVITLHPAAVGSSGVRNFAGYASEEYLQGLLGYQRADIFDKMRRSESQIAMIIKAIKNPIKRALWEVEPADVEEVADAQMHADFAKHLLFDDMDKPFEEFLGEALTIVEFAHSVFEVTDKVVLNHPKFGSYNGIRALGWRSPRTIHRWNLDRANPLNGQPGTGKLVSISQYAYGDLQRTVDIPAEFLMVMTLDKEGDNYEGISLLRPAYGAYLRKDLYLKLMAIGMEKYAIKTPVLRVPPGKENSTEEAAAKNALEIYTSHEASYLTLPEGWTLTFEGADFDPEKAKAAIDVEDQAMVKCVLANFLELGMSNSGGSYALSMDQSDFFLSGIEHIADVISGAVNQHIIRRYIQLKFGPQAKYPKLVHSGISDEAGKELADVLKSLADSNVIIPDEELEAHVRKRFKFPKISKVGQRLGRASSTQATVPALPDELPDAAVAATLAEGAADPLRISLGEKDARRQIQAGKGALKVAMQNQLGMISRDLVSQVMAKVRRLPESQRLDAIKRLQLKGSLGYKQALLDLLGTTAQGALDKARREVPSKKGVKLSEFQDSVRLSDFDRLPAGVQAKVLTQAQLLVDTQLGDLEKAVYFRFTHSVDSTDSDKMLEADLQDAADEYIGGASVEAASGNTTALVVNSARSAFFFEPSVLDEIESFTFVNGDPVSPICQDLAGRTFAKDDPEAQRYFPPLHHNCKSYIVPNLSGSSREIDAEGLKPSSPDLEKSITLSERACACPRF